MERLSIQLTAYRDEVRAASKPIDYGAVSDEGLVARVETLLAAAKQLASTGGEAVEDEGPPIHNVAVRIPTGIRTRVLGLKG
jgi:hypothetical protein